MTVMECIEAAATELGIGQRTREYLEGVSTEGEEEAKTLLKCFNLVENELALDYLPLFAEEDISTDTGAVFYSALERAPVRIVRITDEAGESLPFTVFPEYFKAAAGRLTVRYAYTPTEKTFTDESDFKLFASVRLFAYGMAAEFLFLSGAFEEAAAMDKKYKEAIAAAYRSKPSRRLASRRWA
ncbi:MAG: hypothetical protein IJX88_06330 [Clostridia bacterium]|nr:hypothetical protein [Clostridia bacterium]